MDGATGELRRRLAGGLVSVILAAMGCVGATSPGPSTAGPDPTPAASQAPLDPICQPSVPASASSSPETSLLPSPPGQGPPGMGSGPPVPPPYVPPEGLETLNALARLSGQLPAAEPAPPDAEGVIYLGTKGEQTIDDFMTSVVDNAEFFWSGLLAGGMPCDFDRVARSWIARDAQGVAPCDRSITANRPAYYCGTTGADRKGGAIVVGNRWMYGEVYQRFGDSADFAVASVLAHEMGHHVQDVLGLLRDQRPSRCCGLVTLNIELHADCLAGIWASTLYGRGEIDTTTMAEAVRLAIESGDQLPIDRADSTAHGTGAERQQWFTTGFESGDLDACHPALLLAP